LLGDVAVGGLLQRGWLAVAEPPPVDEPHVRLLVTLDLVVVAGDEDGVVAAGVVLLRLGCPESNGAGLATRFAAVGVDGLLWKSTGGDAGPARCIAVAAAQVSTRRTAWPDPLGSADFGLSAASSQPADSHYLARNANLLEVIADSRAKR
jgi:hypothetical protein